MSLLQCPPQEQGRQRRPVPCAFLLPCATLGGWSRGPSLPGLCTLSLGLELTHLEGDTAPGAHLNVCKAGMGSHQLAQILCPLPPVAAQPCRAVTWLWLGGQPVPDLCTYLSGEDKKLKALRQATHGGMQAGKAQHCAGVA